MPPEDTAAPVAAANEPAEVSFEDALGLMEDDQPQDQQAQAKPKAAPKAAKPTSDDPLDVLADPDEVVEEEKPEAEAAKAAETLADDALIDLGEGKTAKLADLKHAHVALEEVKAATTRVVQEVAQERSTLHNLGANMAQALENVSNYLVQKLPPEPDPNLAYTDPGEHYRQTMIRNNAIAELQDMLSVAEGSKQAAALLSDADFKALKTAEDQKWIESMPTLKDPKRFAAADAKAKAHAKSLGFSEQEVDTTADHRLRTTFWEAARYREIMANAKNAKGKVENASPMAAPKARTQHPNSQAALEQVNGMRALAKSGRLDDAVKLNF